MHRGYLVLASTLFLACGPAETSSVDTPDEAEQAPPKNEAKTAPPAVETGKVTPHDVTVPKLSGDSKDSAYFD